MVAQELPTLPIRECQCDEKNLWQVYYNERQHRISIKNYICEVMKNARTEIPYCNLSDRILLIRPGMGISTAQAVYISLVAVYMDENRERAQGLLQAFMEYCPGYEDTLNRLYSEMHIPTEVGELRDSLAEERQHNSWLTDKVADLEEENSNLRKDNRDLREGNSDLVEENSNLRKEIKTLRDYKCPPQKNPHIIE